MTFSQIFWDVFDKQTPQNEKPLMNSPQTTDSLNSRHLRLNYFLLNLIISVVTQAQTLQNSIFIVISMKFLGQHEKLCCLFIPHFPNNYTNLICFMATKTHEILKM